MRIEGSNILVTGGGSGIGLEMVKHFLKLKAFVVFCDLNKDKCKEIQDQLNIEFPITGGGEEGITISKKEENLFLSNKNTNNNSKVQRCLFIQCDISKEDEVVSMFEKIKEIYNRIDVVVNNAAIGLGRVFATRKNTFKSQDFKKLLDVNTFGQFIVSKYAAKMMIDNITQKKTENTLNSDDINGCIIFIASVSAFEGMIAQMGYSASKAALVSMVLPMARDLGKFKIRVNAIAPGVIDTPMVTKDDPFVKSIINSTPLNVIGSTESICMGVEMLIKVDFINGEVIRVDGGARFPMF